MIRKASDQTWTGHRFVIVTTMLSVGLLLQLGCQPEALKDPPKKRKDVFAGLLENADAEEQTTTFDAGFRLTEVKSSGLDFVHQSGNSDVRPFPAANGSGVAVIDWDLDGLPDLYYGNGTTFPIDVSDTTYTDHFYQNLGDFQFRDLSQFAKVHWQGYTAGVAVGDFNSDGFPDLYLNCYGQNHLYQNQGDGTFVDVTETSQTDDQRWGSSAVFCDYNGDGLLDIYVGNYALWTMETNEACFNGASDRERIFCSPMSVEGAPDSLFENKGDGTFVDVSESSGIVNRVARTQGVLAGDFDGEAGTDLYLGNDMHANSLFMNQGNGKMEDLTDQSGMGYDHTGKSQAGMGLAAADVDQNGTLEVFVTNYANEHNSFYQLVRKNGYAESSSARGLSSDSIQWVGWGTVFLDIDMDQWPDLIVTNGHTDHNKPNEPYEQPCLIWQNQSGRFVLSGGATGSYFTDRHVGRGLATADFDNDGDWDIVFAHLNQPTSILKNDTPQKKAHLSLQLEGRTANRDAIGAKVSVTQGDKTLTYDRLGGGSYLSTHQDRLIIPVDAETTADIEIQWPDGKSSQHQFSSTEIAGGELFIIRQ